MAIDLRELKKLRAETSASVSDCRIALDKSEGDYKKALAWIKKNALSKADKKADRETGQGIIEPYVHGAGRIGVLVEVMCETDFVARTEEFQKLAREIAMQAAAMDPENVDALLAQEYIRDTSKTISDLIKETIAMLGENILLKRFERFGIGE